MLDRPARDAMVDAIEANMNEEIQAFVGWLFVLPFILLGQIFPTRDCRRTVHFHPNRQER